MSEDIKDSKTPEATAEETQEVKVEDAKAEKQEEENVEKKTTKKVEKPVAAETEEVEEKKEEPKKEVKAETQKAADKKATTEDKKEEEEKPAKKPAAKKETNKEEKAEEVTEEKPAKEKKEEKTEEVKAEEKPAAKKETTKEEKTEEVAEEKPAEEKKEEKIEEVKAEEKVEEPEKGTEEVKEEKKEDPVLVAAEPPAFDWDSIDKKQENYTSTERKKLEDIYDNTLKSITEHEVLDGTVVTKNNREVVVNIGFKSDGVIPLSELRYNPDLQVGDKIEVYVENQEDTTGQLVLSHKKARILRSWERINKAYDKDEIINGYVKCRTKGGLIVDVFGIEAFLPGSQIDVKPIRDYDVFVDKTMEFKVVKINHALMVYLLTWAVLTD
jgi:small subunit ribosomal protein S1